MCCRLLSIKEIAKPQNKWCEHCVVGHGCGVYAIRPESCRTFECLWLVSQSTTTPMPGDLRPDKCKVVLHPSTNEMIMSANVDPGFPAAWHKNNIRKVLDKIVLSGMHVVIGWGTGTKKLLLSVRRNSFGMRVVVSEEIEMTLPDADGMQWHIPKQSGAA